MAEYKESDPFYHTKEWRRVREAALQRDHGMCRDCMDKFEAGIVKRPRRAVMVRHVIPRSERPDLELDLNNLRSLCFSCHEEHHPEKRTKPKRQTLEREAQRQGHRMRVIKV